MVRYGVPDLRFSFASPLPQRFLLGLAGRWAYIQRESIEERHLTKGVLVSQRILVRGFESAWWLTALRVLGVITLLTALVMYVNGVPAAVAVTIGGAILLGISESIALTNARKRRWVEDLGDGFLVIDRAGEREFRDEQVTAVCLYSQDNYSEGQLKSVTRHFKVWVDTELSPIEMENKILVDDPDPLAELITRVTDKLRQFGEETLSRGMSLEGDGWSLSSHSLSVHKSAMPEDYQLHELSDIDIFDNQICIWKKGEEQASIRVPVSSRNAHLLFLLLSPKLAERQPADGEPASGLGRVLFERKPPMSEVITLAALSLGGLIGGAVLAVVGEEVAWAGWVLMVAGVGLAIGTWSSLVANFRCHEYGVFQTKLTGTKQLRYDEVASFSYHAVRQYVNGVYSGTTFTLTFTPQASAEAKNITYNTQMKNFDDDLDLLRDHISKVIAGRMANELADGHDVAWTANLTFQKDGLQYRPSGFLGRKEPRHIPYTQVYGFDIQEGVFHIWEHGRDKSTVQEDVSQANFYPGFYLLVHLFSDDGEGEDEGGEDAQAESAAVNENE